jgi:hypothetical protein
MQIDEAKVRKRTDVTIPLNLIGKK